MSLEATRRAVLTGGAALLGAAARGAAPRSAAQRQLVVADRPLSAGELWRQAAPHRIAHAPLLVLAEGPTPGALGVQILSPRALLHLAPERLAALLRACPSLHLAPPAAVTDIPSDRAVVEATLRLLRHGGDLSGCALALESLDDRDALRAAARRMGWSVRAI